MFKALKEKVSTEYEKAKVKIENQAQQLVNNGTIGSLANSIGENRSSTDSSIRRNDSMTSIDSSRSEPKYPDAGFSLVDLDDEPTTAQPSTSKLNTSGDSDSFFRKKFFTNIVQNFIPQSDIESEYESESGSFNVDNVSKEQLVELCYRLKNKGKKYRERWTEVVRAYKQGLEEREKLRTILSETQDKAIRRVNELKEQCNLEQEAKRHLEENLQVTIEEKEEQIKVLQQKIQLMNSGEKNIGELIDLDSGEKVHLAEKVERLESLLSKCNESLKANKEKLEVLTKENEQLLDYKDRCLKLEVEVESVKKLKDSASSSFTEAKQKLHDELESHKIIIKELKDQNEKKNHEIRQKNNEIKSKIATLKGLNEQIQKMESNFEMEKKNLTDELTKSKADALNSLREECESKLEANNQKFTAELQSLTEENKSLKEAPSVDVDQSMLEEQQKLTAELRTELEQTNSKLKDALDQLENIQVERDEERKSLEQKLSDSESASKEHCLEIERLQANVNNLVNLEQELRQSKQQLEVEKSKLIDSCEKLESLNEQVKSKDERIRQLEVEADNFKVKMEEEMNKCRLELQSQQISDSETFDELKKTIDGLQKTNETNIAKLNQVESDIKSKDEELQKLANEKRKLLEEISQVKQSISSSEGDVDQIRRENTNLGKSLEISKNLINKLRESESQLQDSLKDFECIRTELNELKSKTLNFRNVIVELFCSDSCNRESIELNELISEIKTVWLRLLERADTSEQAKGNFYKFTEELLNQMDATSEEMAELEQMQSQNQRLENDLQKRDIELRSQFEKNESLIKQLELSQHELEELRVVLEEKYAQLDQKSAELDRLQESQSNQQQELSDLKERLQSEDQSMAKYQSIAELLEKVQKDKEILEKKMEEASEAFEEACGELQESQRQNAVYVEEITKIKSNAKEILESKHKLNEKFQQSESSLQSLKKEYQKAIKKNEVQEEKASELMAKLEEAGEQIEEYENNLSQASEAIEERDEQIEKMRKYLAKLEEKMSSSNSDQEERLNQISEELQESQQKCIELEEKLKMKNTGEADLKTEVIALEEKLKRNVKNEAQLREELKINDELNSSLKEQVCKYMNEINELKNELESIKSKHEDAIDKLYKQLEVRESQLDESLMNANSQYNSTAQELLRSKSEITRLNKEIEELQSSNTNLDDKLQSVEKRNDDHLKQITEKYETQIKDLESQVEQQKLELNEKMDQFDNGQNKLIVESKNRICQLEDEINEKNVALSEIHDYYQQKLKTKDSEVKSLHEQLSNPDKNNFQINALQKSVLQYHEENSRLKELIQMRQDKANDNRNSEHMENCALLGVHLPQPTEYEYLRNILYEFMMGREPVTLSKVIAAVMRFSSEQTDQIIKRQETLHATKAKQANHHHS